MQPIWNFAWKLKPVMSDFQPQTIYKTVKFIFATLSLRISIQKKNRKICAGGLRHCGISTELKFYETKPDGAVLMPTSHDCEDDERVDGSPVSLATVYVHVFRT